MPTRLPSSWPADGDAVLVLAQSGRALAAAARRAGLRPFVADLFGDADTRALAQAYRPVAGRFGAGPGAESVLAALQSLLDEAGEPVLGVVLGSGFETAPALIAAIGARTRLLGAGAEVVARLKDPSAFAALLADLGASHPPIRLAPGADGGDWFIKRRGGSGGGHVRPARPGQRPPPGHYLQRRVAGRPCGVAFLADGRTAQILGATDQWATPSARAPFRYAGAVEPGTLPDGVLAEIAPVLDGLVGATGLRGLASVDLLVDDAAWWLLEINPRPGGTLDVLDRRATPLLRRHIEACLGRLGPAEAPPPQAAATEILYAERTIPIVPPLDWPDHVTDRPAPGSRVAAGAPLCTLRAEAADAAGVRALLHRRATQIRRFIQEGTRRDIPLRPPERERPRGAAGRSPHR